MLAPPLRPTLRSVTGGLQDERPLVRGAVGAGGGDIADAEGRHFLLLGFAAAAHPPLFIDVDPMGDP